MEVFVDNGFIPHAPLRTMLELIEVVTNKINSYGVDHAYEYYDFDELLLLCKGNDNRLILTLSKIDKWEDVYKFTEKLESL